MSDGDTGETSRFKIKCIEPVTNVEGTTNSGDNSHNDDNQSPLSLLQYKKLTNIKREKIKGRDNHHQNICHQIQRIRPPQKIQLRKLILLKATDVKLPLNLRAFVTL